MTSEAEECIFVLFLSNIMEIFEQRGLGDMSIRQWDNDLSYKYMLHGMNNPDKNKGEEVLQNGETSQSHVD